MMMTRSVPRGSAASFDRTLFERVNRAALSQLEDLCREWGLRGRKLGAEYLALNPRRADKSLGSFRINLRNGRWADFATGDTGGDPVSLYAYLHDLRQIDAARALARHLGVHP
jgi:hypothetical protein